MTSAYAPRYRDASGQVHEPEPTPDQDPTVADVAALLLAGAAVATTAAAIYSLLRRRGRAVSPSSVAAALALASARGSMAPNSPWWGNSGTARAQQRQEAHYRAAYVMSAAERIERARRDAAGRFIPPNRRPSTPDTSSRPGGDASRRPGDDGPAAPRTEAEAVDDATAKALERERRYEAQHAEAERRRMDAAITVRENVDAYGPVLGWWAHDDDRTTPECRAADGSNFRADQAPVIGWPGTPHGGTCRCEPGPPHPDGPWTDEATGMAGVDRKGRR